MPQAVRFEKYGAVDVLEVVEVESPRAAPGQVVVEVVATSINPGEIMIREGAMEQRTPGSFPSGQGSDLAGRVSEVGADVTTWGVGDEVIGWTDERAAQAEYVAVPADQLVRRPPEVPWEQAGSLYVAGGTAAGMVQTLAPRSGDVVLVSAAAGGVGCIAVQLLREAGVHVIGVAGPDNQEWLRSVGVDPVLHGDGLTERLRGAAPDGFDGLLDCFGGGYVDIAEELGIDASRIVTIADFAAAEQGRATVVVGFELASSAMLSDLAGLIAAGRLSIPIAATYPLSDVRTAYTRLAERHTRGKIVLRVPD